MPTPTPVASGAGNPSQPPVTTAAGGENFSWYTVKENENLWKIASEQLGSGNAWTQIRDLNPDILKGENQVRRQYEDPDSEQAGGVRAH